MSALSCAVVHLRLSLCMCEHVLAISLVPVLVPVRLRVPLLVPSFALARARVHVRVYACALSPARAF
eukprot:9437198-Alexandrium_andersonii.AAC.1